MQARFTNSIAAAEWAYDEGQVVTIGRDFTFDEVPADLADKWLASGLLVRVDDVPESMMVGARETGMRPAARRR